MFLSIASFESHLLSMWFGIFRVLLSPFRFKSGRIPLSICLLIDLLLDLYDGTHFSWSGPEPENRAGYSLGFETPSWLSIVFLLLFLWQKDTESYIYRVTMICQPQLTDASINNYFR